MRKGRHAKNKNKVAIALASIIAFFIVILLGLYFFTDIFTANKVNNNLSNNENVTEDQPENNTEPNNELTNNEAVENEDETQDNENLTEENDKLDIQTLSNNIIKALDERDMETISTYVHPEKGLLFSPYIYVTEDAVVFDKSEVSGMLESEEKFNWGDYDGKGTPIELTPAEYFDKFLDMAPFLNQDEILIDNLQDRGNTKNNVKETFTDAQIIEYYNEGSEEYGGIDWNSILLIYEEDEAGQLQLIAIIRDMWTI